MPPFKFTKWSDEKPGNFIWPYDNKNPGSFSRLQVTQEFAQDTSPRMIIDQQVTKEKGT